MNFFLGPIRWFVDIVKGFLTVLVGMKVTLRHFLERRGVGR